MESFGRSGSVKTPILSFPPCFELTAPPFPSWSIISVSWSPRNIDIIAGGASFAPSLWSFPGTAAESSD